MPHYGDYIRQLEKALNRCLPREHKWGPPTMLMAGGYGFACHRCGSTLTYEQLFAAVGTTAYKALEAWEQEQEDEMHRKEAAEAMIKSPI